MLLAEKTVAIVGGGPGGLTLARLLQLQGVKVQVYERDASRASRVQGATLDLHEESGLAALRQAGLIEAFYAHHRPEAGKLRIVDPQLAISYDWDNEHEHESRPEIDRGPLRTILLDSLAPDTVVWDCQFASMEHAGDGWLLRFKNGTTAQVDVVIGADGARSQIRPYLSPIAPCYSGITIVEGNLYAAAKHAPVLYQLVDGGKVFALGKQQSLILSAKGDGSLAFYTGCKVSEAWVQSCGIDFNNKNSVLAWFKQAFAEWDAAWQALFAGDEMTFVPRPQYYYPLDQAWEAQPNLTIIGDAAHVMPPYAGEGVNMALQDALELAKFLTSAKFSSIHVAIAAFEQTMLKRAAEVTQLTLASTEMLHSDNSIEQLIAMFSEVA
ncbi:FAD-dependent oxidoreductase [Herpetosiphon llansteffanensis]|uniref:FAD-dependent oxidoreductase n=1 Tax=Herpetosiphon llansteffanensis TaxID=2094568 RepID=UPI000D7C73EB|nr:NAD(P)/FAD-dependent oxidoreductase [Herpetosiphon llansteffanensis]